MFIAIESQDKLTKAKRLLPYLLLTVRTWSELPLVILQSVIPLSSISFAILSDRNNQESWWICEGMDELCMYKMHQKEAWHLEDRDKDGKGGR